MMKRIIDFIKNAYLGIIFFFLYAPIATMVVLSFNANKSRGKWGGFSLKWYKEMFADRGIMDALQVTLLIAFVSAFVATIIGVLSCIGINSMRKTPKAIWLSINNIPLLNADIVTGLSLMLCFITFKWTLGYSSILIAHISFNIPYVILSVMPKLKQTSNSLYEAALDLGATPTRAFFKVIFPDLIPGIVSGFLLSFSMSIDDFVITHFTKGRGINTLSTLIYSQAKRGVKPSMYALSTLLFMSVLILLLISNFLPKAKERSTKKLQKQR